MNLEYLIPDRCDNNQSSRHDWRGSLDRTTSQRYILFLIWLYILLWIHSKCELFHWQSTERPYKNDEGWFDNDCKYQYTHDRGTERDPSDSLLKNTLIEGLSRTTHSDRYDPLLFPLELEKDRVHKGVWSNHVLIKLRWRGVTLFMNRLIRIYTLRILWRTQTVVIMNQIVVLRVWWLFQEILIMIWMLQIIIICIRQREVQTVTDYCRHQGPSGSIPYTLSIQLYTLSTLFSQSTGEPVAPQLEYYSTWINSIVSWRNPKPLQSSRNSQNYIHLHNNNRCYRQLVNTVQHTRW